MGFLSEDVIFQKCTVALDGTIEKHTEEIGKGQPQSAVRWAKLLHTGSSGSCRCIRSICPGCFAECWCSRTGGVTLAQLYTRGVLIRSSVLLSGTNPKADPKVLANLTLNLAVSVGVDRAFRSMVLANEYRPLVLSFRAAETGGELESIADEMETSLAAALF